VGECQSRKCASTVSIHACQDSNSPTPVRGLAFIAVQNSSGPFNVVVQLSHVLPCHSLLGFWKNSVVSAAPLLAALCSAAQQSGEVRNDCCSRSCWKRRQTKNKMQKKVLKFSQET
jgi:hypothetical protein